MQTVAFKYALGQPLDWSPESETQLVLSNRLWNKLVEVERAHVVAVRAVIADDDQMRAIGEQQTALRERLDSLKTEKKRASQVARKKVPTPELDSAIAATIAALKALAEPYKIAKKAATAAGKEKLKVLNASRFDSVKVARQEAATAGLWWGNYNAVMESFETASNKARKEGAELHFRRFDGSGRLTNQIQGGMSVQELFAGTHSQVQVVAAPGRTIAKRQYNLVVTACAPGRQKVLVRFPLILHRPLPENAQIQMVVVHRRKMFDRFQWSVVFNLRVDDVVPSCSDSVAVVNFGWRKVEDVIRVATVLRDDKVDFIELPRHMIVGQEAGERNQGRIDDEINRMLGWLENLNTEHANEKTQEVVAKIRSFKKLRGNHLEWLRETWELDSSKWNVEGLTELQAFGKLWRRFKRDDAAGRQWLADARLEHYRLEVRRLVGDASVVVMNEHDMSETARVDNNDLPLAARHQRKLAAPSLLRGCLVEWSRKTGSRIATDDAKHDRCACHSELFVHNDRSKLMWACPVTHLGLDQDVDFCRGMFNRFGDAERAGVASIAEDVAKKPNFRANRKRVRNDEPMDAE